MTIADKIKTATNPEDQYSRAVAWMIWRDCKPTYVTFHFEDGSSVTFKKSYQLA